MPVYEFECSDCGHRFTETISISEYEEGKVEGFRCPECGKRNVEQLVSTVMVETSRKS